MKQLNLNSDLLPNFVPGKVHCLICLENVPQSDPSCDQKVVEVLSDLFKVLCDSMNWTTSNKYHFNFNTYPFPFCKHCRLLAVKLYKESQLPTESQGSIEHLTTELCSKIIRSQNKAAQISQGGLVNWDKIRYYRNVIISRYSPSVKVIIEPNLWDKRSTLENVLTIKRGESVPSIEKIYKHGGSIPHFKPSSGRAYGRVRSLGNDKYLFDGMYPFEYNAGGKWTCLTCKYPFSRKEKLIRHLLRPCKGAGNMKNRCNIARRAAFKPYLADGISRLEVTDDGTSDANLEQKTYFRPGRGKFYERVRCAGSRVYLFDGKYSFQLNSERKWTCCTCSHAFCEKRELLAHLNNICKGPKIPKPKPFSCDICDKKFTRSSSVIRHKQEVHDPAKKHKRIQNRLKENTEQAPTRTNNEEVAMMSYAMVKAKLPVRMKTNEIVLTLS